MSKNKILIVENTETGEQYKQLVERELDIEVIWVRTESEALEAVENNFIKIAVLDQRLSPGELGTEVYKKIRERQPNILGIMISGKAGGSEVYEALSHLKFFKFVDKENILELPESIREALEAYNIPRFTKRINSQRKLIHQFRKGFSIFPNFEVYLLDIKLLDENYIFEDRWVERMSVEAGNNLSNEFEIEFKNNVELEKKSTLELTTKYSNTLKLLKNSLSSELAGKLNSEIRSKESSEIRIKSKITQSLSVPPIPSDVKLDYLASKSFQTNQVYEKYICHIEIVCKHCSIPEIMPIILYFPISKIAKRQIDILRSGKETVIPTGFTRTI
jgi:response regulator RpfG family c-di-GMP phosphodiesterase